MKQPINTKPVSKDEYSNVASAILLHYLNERPAPDNIIIPSDKVYSIAADGQSRNRYQANVKIVAGRKEHQVNIRFCLSNNYLEGSSISYV